MPKDLEKFLDRFKFCLYASVYNEKLYIKRMNAAENLLRKSDKVELLLKERKLHCYFLAFCHLNDKSTVLAYF